MNIIEFIGLLDTRVAKRLSMRTKEEEYVLLIKEHILINGEPHVKVKRLYDGLKKNGSIDFSYQYFTTIVKKHWTTMVDGDGDLYLIVSSENNPLCGW